MCEVCYWKILHVMMQQNIWREELHCIFPSKIARTLFLNEWNSLGQKASFPCSIVVPKLFSEYTKCLICSMFVHISLSQMTSAPSFSSLDPCLLVRHALFFSFQYIHIINVFFFLEISPFPHYKTLFTTLILNLKYGFI